MSAVVGSGTAGGQRSAKGTWGRLLRAVLAALLAAGALAVVAAPAGGQSEGAGEATQEPVVGVRIAAQRGADGRTEFALQHDPEAHTGAPYSWGERLLLSSDRCFRSDLCAFGGVGYSHVFTVFFEMLRAEGLDDESLDLVTIANPRRALAW